MSKKKLCINSKKVRNMEVMIIVLFIIIFVLLIHSFINNKNNNSFIVHESIDCEMETKNAVIDPESLSDDFKDKTAINYIEGYYKCNPVMRGDYIVYNYGETKVVAKVLGVPGDKIDHERRNLIINGKIQQNSEGMPYTFKSELLKIDCEQSIEIPDASYVIMTDIVSGGNDSSKFGLASKSEILGKVQK